MKVPETGLVSPLRKRIISSFNPETNQPEVTTDSYAVGVGSEKQFFNLRLVKDST
jgi:hypothetical protein